MRHDSRGGLLGLVLAMLFVASSAPAQNAACDRGCLESMLDAYVDAVAARAPSRLNVAPNRSVDTAEESS